MPRPIIIPDVMELTTPADVRALVEKHLPAEYRSKFTRRQLAGLLKRAAEGQQEWPRCRLRCGSCCKDKKNWTKKLRRRQSEGTRPDP